MSYSRSELRGSLRWLLTLQVGGRTIRLAEEGVDVDAAAYTALGGVLRFQAGLIEVSPPTLTLADAGEVPEASAKITWIHPTEGGWAELVEADTDLADVRAELALWVEGTDWAAREVLVSGPLSGITYDAPHVPIEATISETTADDAGLVPGPDQVVAETTWPRTSASGMILPTDSAGQVYPLVVGAPGALLATDTVEVVYGWPAVVVELDDSDRDNSVNACTVLLCGEDCVGVGASATLHNLTTDPATSASVTLTRTTDLLGRPVVVASVAAATLAIAEGDDLWWSASSTTPLGLLSPSGRASGLAGAGDWIRYLALRSTLAWDLAVSEADLERLNGYRLDLVASEPKKPSELILDVLRLLPASLYRAPGGLAVRAWPLQATEADALLRVGPVYGCQREPGITVSDDADRYDAYQVTFGRDAKEGTYLRSIALVPDPDPADTRQIQCPWTVPANARSGKPPTRWGWRWAETIEAPMLADPGAATALLLEQARASSQSRRTVTYVCPVDYLVARPGAVVLWVDAEVAVEGRLCRVVQAETGLTSCRLTLETIPDSLRAGLGPT